MDDEIHHLPSPAACYELAERVAFELGISAYELDDFQERASELAHDHDMLDEGYDLTDDDVRVVASHLAGATLTLGEA